MLKTRLHEHFLAMKRGDNLSQIWDHCSNLGHEVSFKNTKIIARSDKKQERLFFEALFSGINSYNRHIDIDVHMSALARNFKRRRKNQ